MKRNSLIATALLIPCILFAGRSDDIIIPLKNAIGISVWTLPTYYREPYSFDTRQQNPVTGLTFSQILGNLFLRGGFGFYSDNYNARDDGNSTFSFHRVGKYNCMEFWLGVQKKFSRRSFKPYAAFSIIPFRFESDEGHERFFGCFSSGDFDFIEKIYSIGVSPSAGISFQPDNDRFSLSVETGINIVYSNYYLKTSESVQYHYSGTQWFLRKSFALNYHF